MGTNYPKDLLPPNNGKGIFDLVKTHLKNNDIVFGNLEGPLTFSEDQTKCRDENENCFAFRSPPGYADHLKLAGFNVMNIANNHTADFGYEGIEIDGKRPHGNPLDWPAKRCRELRSFSDGEGIEIHGVAANNDFSSPIPEYRECQVAYVKELIRMTSDLGARTLRMFLKRGPVSSLLSKGLKDRLRWHLT